MADKYIPPGWDEEKVLAGLHKAMAFGKPNDSAAEATFYFKKLSAFDAEEADTTGVPYDPDERRSNVAAPKFKTVACAVEFFDALGSIETFGIAKPTRIKITLLQPEWEQVFDFTFVMANGDRYHRGIEEPAPALGSIDIHVIWCNAEGEH